MRPVDRPRHIGILNLRPLVLLSCIDGLAPLDVNLADEIAQNLHRPFSLILEIWQSWEHLAEYEPDALRAIAGSILRHCTDNPENKILIACNTRAEVNIAHDLGLEASFLNHNAFVNETIFEPLSNVDRVYDAVYNAQMWIRKRHELAAQIDTICLIFGMHLGDAARQRFREVSGFMPHAFLANGNPLAGADAYRYLKQKEVNYFYNRSRVGLCLSAHEGASLAAAEYLLAGIPIVSTSSKGGRDILFQQPWCLICNESPLDVSSAVRTMIERDIPPSIIRAGTLQKIETLRGLWIDCVQDLCANMDGAGLNRFAESL